ncbi:hypothetical protein BRD17_04190 [Halobacteriales archaeon SW_7_68_16]|nr:MAG: hypothetical protein BRD17_04190 [Halobacteriales archaeon SW_7_68_16]
MSATARSGGGEDLPDLDPLPELTEKQERIRRYLYREAETTTYFKSRLIADALDMTSREVGANVRAVRDAPTAIAVEKWGYSSATTWKVTR